ncbi:hypothetical protein [Pelagibacterium lacus]|uniref:Uncharacterized protein n=1 Tax=Pelagibacterium lacus TaxID=2282655 RepID=A0A369W9W9_9HYPH|nr:hypothetical protein [Pelagibacterium lacus]RDE10160.1 hypothetical protein DVH29_01825 [Pelagibacterium lacus]
MAFTRRPIACSSPAPIRGYNRRGFLIGWIAIVLVVGTSFYFAAGRLDYRQSHLRLAHSTAVHASELAAEMASGDLPGSPG